MEVVDSRRNLPPLHKEVAARVLGVCRCVSWHEMSQYNDIFSPARFTAQLFRQTPPTGLGWNEHFTVRQTHFVRRRPDVLRYLTPRRAASPPSATQTR